MHTTPRRLVAAACLSLVAVPLTAQTGLQVTAGATSSSVLVNDGLLLTKLQPAVAPTVGVAVVLPTGKGPYRVRLEAHYSRSTLNVTANGVRDHLAPLTTIDAVVMAEGPMIGQVRWQVGGGALFYRPSENQGVFLDGPTRRWLVAIGGVFSQPLAPHLTLLINGRVDAHGFQTDVLRARNYAGAQGVQRFMLQVGIERTL